MSIRKVPASQEMTPVHLRANRSAFAMWFGRSVLRVFGWHIEGEIPNHERILIIGAPHTSNWDFVWLLAGLVYQISFAKINQHSLCASRDKTTAAPDTDFSCCISGQRHIDYLCKTVF